MNAGHYTIRTANRDAPRVHLTASNEHSAERAAVALRSIGYVVHVWHWKSRKYTYPDINGVMRWHAGYVRVPL